jgi:hypothetical protein
MLRQANLSLDEVVRPVGIEQLSEHRGAPDAQEEVPRRDDGPDVAPVGDGSLLQVSKQ